MEDKLLAGRQTYGASTNTAKLTTEETQLIRDLYATGSYSQATLAKQFNCSQTNISAIVRYKTRKVC